MAPVEQLQYSGSPSGTENLEGNRGTHMDKSPGNELLLPHRAKNSHRVLVLCHIPLHYNA